MIAYDEYERLIVERLSRDGIDVSPLPLIRDLNTPRVVTKPRIYVIFSESSFDDTSHLGEFAQDESLSFEVYIQALTRDGKNGIFAIAEEAMQKLLKWRFPDATQRITLASFGYAPPKPDAPVQNNWQYMLKFSFPRLHMKPEEEPDPIRIKKITHILEPET